MVNELNVITLMQKSKTTIKKQLNIYLIHAIGGTIYPYYSMLQCLPTKSNVYGISYTNNLKAKTLNELADFYAQQVINYKYFNIKFNLIQILKHSNSIPFLLIGHSLGGILAREIAIIINTNSKIAIKIPFVVAIDSWVIGTENLDLSIICDYLNVIKTFIFFLI